MLIINPYRYAAVLASASDNFDSYADLSDLNGQGNWVVEVGSFIVDKAASDGIVRCVAGGVDSVARKSTPLFAPNQSAEMTLRAGIAAAGVIGPMVRCQTGAGTGYGGLYDAASSVIYLFYMSAGSWTPINTASRSYVGNEKLKVRVTGSGASTRLAMDEDIGSGWVNIWTNQDPTFYLSTGQPGLYGYGNEGTTGWHGDNWAANDI